MDFGITIFKRALKDSEVADVKSLKKIVNKL